MSLCKTYKKNMRMKPYLVMMKNRKVLYSTNLHSGSVTNIKLKRVPTFLTPPQLKKVDFRKIEILQPSFMKVIMIRQLKRI